MTLIKLGVSGDAGSFSEEAGLLYANNNKINLELVCLTDMEGVLSAIENRSINIGILPVVNLRGGLVRMAFDAMGKHRFKVIDELWLNVQHSLLVKPGTNKCDIQNIVSHPQAFAQCGHYLQKNFQNIQLIDWQDTAAAARELSAGKLSSENAVIAPERSAHLYNLAVVERNIQDDNPNFTVFIIVKNYKEDTHAED